MIAVVVMYALFALTFPLAKLAMGQVASPFFFLALRMLIAGAGMLLLSFRLKRPRITPSDVALFAAAGFFAIFVAFGFEFWAIRFVSSIKVNIFYSLSPFMTALFSYLMLGERLSARKILGLSVGFLGMIPLAWDVSVGVATLVPTTVHDGALLISVASAALAWILIKKLLQRGFPMLFINGVMTLAGGLMCALGYVATSGFDVPMILSWPLLLGYMASLILISNVIGYTMYGTLLHTYSPTFLSFSGFLCPLFGLFYGYTFMGEAIRLVHILALGCVLVGLLMFYGDEPRA